MEPTSPTQMASQLFVQQKVSCEQISLTHESQLLISLAPVEHSQ